MYTNSKDVYAQQRKTCKDTQKYTNDKRIYLFSICAFFTFVVWRFAFSVCFPHCDSVVFAHFELPRLFTTCPLKERLSYRENRLVVSSVLKDLNKLWKVIISLQFCSWHHWWQQLLPWAKSQHCLGQVNNSLSMVWMIVFLGWSIISNTMCVCAWTPHCLVRRWCVGQTRPR